MSEWLEHEREYNVVGLLHRKIGRHWEYWAPSTGVWVNCGRYGPAPDDLVVSYDDTWCEPTEDTEGFSP